MITGGKKNGQASLGWRLWKIRPLLDLGNQFCVDQKPDTPRFYHQFSSGLKPQIAQMSKGVGAHTGFLSSSFFSFYTVTEGAQGPGGSTLEDVSDTGVQSPGWGSTGQLDKGSAPPLRLNPVGPSEAVLPWDPHRSPAHFFSLRLSLNNTTTSPFCGPWKSVFKVARYRAMKLGWLWWPLIVRDPNPLRSVHLQWAWLHYTQWHLPSACPSFRNTKFTCVHTHAWK